MPLPVLFGLILGILLPASYWLIVFRHHLSVKREYEAAGGAYWMTYTPLKRVRDEGGSVVEWPVRWISTHVTVIT